MKRLNNNIVFLLIYLMIAFSLDKITFGVNQTIFAFSQFTYVLISISVLLIVSIPFLQKAKFGYLFAGGMVIYALIKLVLIKSVKISSQILPYYVLSEIFLYSIGIYYASKVGESLVRMKDVIDKAILPNTNQRIFKKDKAGTYIENEFVRGRRYNYPITALVIEPDASPDKFPTEANIDTAINEIQNKIKTKYITIKFSDILCNQIRLSDMIVELDENTGKYLIICPELSSENSVLFGERLKQAVNRNMGISVNYGVLNFPKDVLTFEAMLDKAENVIRDQHKARLNP